MSMKQLMATAAVFTVGATGVASAQSIKVHPGLWESTTKITGMMSTSRTDTKCFEDGEWSAEDLMAEDLGACEPTNLKMTDDTMSFDIACTQNGMSLTGDLNYTTKGKSGSGYMNVTMSSGGMNLPMRADFSSKWLGPC